MYMHTRTIRIHTTPIGTTHTHACTHTQARTHARTHTHMHTHTHAHTGTHARTRAHTHMHTHTHTHTTHTHTHACTHTHMHTRTCTHTHTSYSSLLLVRKTKRTSGPVHSQLKYYLSEVASLTSDCPGLEAVGCLAVVSRSWHPTRQPSQVQRVQW